MSRRSKLFPWTGTYALAFPTSSLDFSSVPGCAEGTNGEKAGVEGGWEIDSLYLPYNAKGSLVRQSHPVLRDSISLVLKILSFHEALKDQTPII